MSKKMSIIKRTSGLLLSASLITGVFAISTASASEAAACDTSVGKVTDGQGDVKNVFYDPMRNTQKVSYGSGPADILSVTQKTCEGEPLMTLLQVKNIDKLTTYTVYLATYNPKLNTYTNSETKRVTKWEYASKTQKANYYTKFYTFNKGTKKWVLKKTEVAKIVTNTNGTKKIVATAYGSTNSVKATTRRVQPGRDSSYISTDQTIRL